MSTHATGTLEMKVWEERPYAQTEGAPKLARANGSDLYHGDIEGEATFEYLMIYGADSSVSFVGLERVAGRLGERSGSFVLKLDGIVEAGTGIVRSTWSVMPGSGTEELQGLRGEGGLVYKHDEISSITLDYDLD